MVDKINDPLNPFLAVRMYGVGYIVNGCEWLTKAETVGIFWKESSGNDEDSPKELLLEQTGDSRNWFAVSF